MDGPKPGHRGRRGVRGRVGVEQVDGERRVDAHLLAFGGEPQRFAEAGGRDAPVGQCPAHRLALGQRERGQVEQVSDVRVLARGGHDRAAVRVPDEHRGLAEPVQLRDGGGDVVLEARHRQLDGRARHARGLEPGADAVPRPARR